jgi:hypothetical protein
MLNKVDPKRNGAFILALSSGLEVPEQPNSFLEIQIMSLEEVFALMKK